MNSIYRIGVIGLLVFSLSNIGNVALAEVILADSQMVPTSVLVEQLSRSESEQKVLNLLSKEDVQKKLVEAGINVDEAKARVASLSNHELQTLTVQMDKAQYGGDILFTILIVVLIIFIVKRL